MFSYNKKIGVQNNPLTQSVFNERFEEALISPGTPEFIITENSKKIITEDGKFIITEGS